MGRLTAYDGALKVSETSGASKKSGITALQEALHRNLFREGEVVGKEEALAKQIIAIAQKVTDLDDDAFLAGPIADDVLAIPPQS